MQLKHSAGIRSADMNWSFQNDVVDLKKNGKKIICRHSCQSAFDFTISYEFGGGASNTNTQC